MKESHEANILAVLPIQSTSHMTVNKAIVIELANRGHNVTVVSAYPEENPPPNYKDIVLKKMSVEELMGKSGI